VFTVQPIQTDELNSFTYESEIGVSGGSFDATIGAETLMTFLSA
jgi:hypothetical protein